MKLDVNVLRYLTKDDFRVLTAVEMGQKNHEIVPSQLVDTISGLKHGGAGKCLKTLLRHKLVHHDSTTYDGFRLTYQGYDFLAIKAMCNRGHIAGVGRQIGVGKESDIYEVTNEEGEVFALKLHRLGRTSFRAVKSKRDYLGKRQSFSWLYLSRLSALKEYAFMKALGEHDFAVPQAIDHNRHAVLMTMLHARPLVTARRLTHPAKVYLTCMDIISRLAGKGLIHCDFNEFNLMIDENEELTLIDFPQMVSVSHANAKELFDRDVECIVRFFTKKIGYAPERDPTLPYVRPVFELVAAIANGNGAEGDMEGMGGGLDVALAASGFQGKHQKLLEEFGAQGAGADSEEGGSDDSEGDADEGCEVDRAGMASKEGPEGANRSATSCSGNDAGHDASATSFQPPGSVADHEDGTAVTAVANGSEADEASDISQQSEQEDDGDGVGDSPSEDESILSKDCSHRGDGNRGRATAVRVPMRSAVPAGERQVQALLVAQRKREEKKAALVRASHNCQTKLTRGRRSKSTAANGAAGDFGGW